MMSSWVTCCINNFSNFSSLFETVEDSNQGDMPFAQIWRFDAILSVLDCNCSKEFFRGHD
jgi:hypothetical protein